MIQHKSTRKTPGHRFERRHLGAIAAATLLLISILAFPQSEARGQTEPTSIQQLTISTDTEREALEDTLTSVVFEGAYALTLLEGQTLRPVFISRQAGAELNLGDGSIATQGGAWTIVGNSPSWNGTTNVLTGNTLTISSAAANPLGAWSETNTGAFSTTNLYNGATLKLPARAVGGNGEPQIGETKIGELTTDARMDAENQADAVVDVGVNQTLTVENGLAVDKSVGLTKRGSGTLQLLANGTETSVFDETTNQMVVSSDNVAFDLGKLTIAAGEFRIADGTSDVEAVDLSAAAIKVGKEATLDIQSTEAIELTGVTGDVVFSADDGSNINLYMDADGGTKYVAKTFNTYMKVGATTLNVHSSVKGSTAPKTHTVFTTADVGQIDYDPDAIVVVDNILGRNYAVDTVNSTADSIVLKLVDNQKFAEISSLNNNEKTVAATLDKLVATDAYNDAEYQILSALEDEIADLNFVGTTGEIYASSVGFFYMNNMTQTQTLFDHLRNNALVAYSGASSAEPMDYGPTRRARNAAAPGTAPITSGYGSGGAFDQGPLYYDSNSNSYGPGVVPVPQQTGAQTNYGVYNGEIYTGQNPAGGATSVGTTDSPGVYNLGWTPQRSTLATMRGQATYGDPGTLIYSAWFQAFGSSNDARVHKKYYGYDAKQFGFMAGLDLFGSCDCRFGAYYGYQRNEMNAHLHSGKIKTNEHTIGLYHQFGDETIYNIGVVRAGYGRFKTTRDVTVGSKMSALKALGKFDGWNAGATFERGANFKAEPFVFTPYAQLDYNFFLRRKFTESDGGVYALKIGKSNYHSLRGQIGGRIALDMYPGDQHIRLLISAAYVHEFLNAMYGKTWASFQGLPNADGFAIYGNSLGRDWCLLGLGADWSPIPALDLFVKGNYAFNKYTRTPYSSAGLKFRW